MLTGIQEGSAALHVREWTPVTPQTMRIVVWRWGHDRLTTYPALSCV